jgi:hypothetical protein
VRTVPPGFGAPAAAPPAVAALLAGVPVVVAAPPAAAGTGVEAAGTAAAAVGTAVAAAGAAGVVGVPCPHAASSAALLDKASNFNADRLESVVACMSVPISPLLQACQLALGSYTRSCQPA